MVDQESKEDSLDNSMSVTRQKIIFIGDSGVGKTALINRITGNPFSENYEPSIGVDFCSRLIKFKDGDIKLQIWDTAGQEKFRSLIPSYLRNSAIAFVVYDVNKLESFERVPEWINYIKEYQETIIVVCGNKIDLETRVVQTNEGKEFADKNNVLFFETSAKTNEGVMNMFFGAIATLPLFGEGAKPEDIVKELIKQNLEEDNKKLIGNQENVAEKPLDLNVKGGTVQEEENGTKKKKKKKCQC